MARLADSVDELDGVLLSALEELQRMDNAELDGADAEADLSAIWIRTFTVLAAAQEEWMEEAFVRRGHAILDLIYPDRDERRRLYQYGFTPFIGRRFEEVVPEIMERLQGADGYGGADDPSRLALFFEFGGLLAEDRGFGFRVRRTVTDQAMLDNWQGVLSWWMRGPNHEAPEPKHLRGWQRFVSDNLEFRLGVALGAVVARAWSDGVEGELVVPSLETWRETTGLPWFGFWARELLRWGTLDPFVAFALAEGVAGTRDDAEQLRQEFDGWLNELRDEVSSEDRIDPQLFLEWHRSRGEIAVRRDRQRTASAVVVGTDGSRNQYSVIPVVSDDTIYWFDAAGFSLAQTDADDSPFRGLIHRDDYLLRTDQESPTVTQTFAGVR